MGWIDELRRVSGHVTPSMPDEDVSPKAIPVRHALTAARLDLAGIDLDPFRTGVTVVEIDGQTESLIAAEAIRSILSAGGRNAAHYSAPSPGEIFVLDGQAHMEDAEKVIRSGAHLVVVVDAADRSDAKRELEKDDIRGSANLEKLRRIADRLVTVVPRLDRSVVAQTVRAVTGDEVREEDVATIPVDDLVLTIRLGDTGAEAAARIRMISERMAPKKADAETERALTELGEIIMAQREQRANPVPENPKTPRLSELSGFGPAREWGLRLAEDFRGFRSGYLVWEDMDRGILLSGPPGTGKTFFARALAEECGVELVLSSYTEIEAATGSGNLVAKAIKQVFASARKKAPCILFIDEMDAVGSRGAHGRNNSWFDVVINAFLSELDGASPRDGVVVVGATNHADRIDPALLRPGRLERVVEIPLPSIDDLQGIVRHHLGIDSREAAVAVRGRSPAQVAMDAREARRRARREKRQPTADDLRAVVAESRPNLSPEMVRLVAIHEFGHAVRAAMARHAHLVDIDLDQGHTTVRMVVATEDAIMDDIAITLAGRAAEQVILGSASVGSGDDLSKATARAHALETRLGYGVTGLVVIADDAPTHVFMSAVRKRLDDVYEETIAFVRRSRASIERLADALIERRFMDADEALRVIRDVPIFRTSREEWGEADDRPVGSRASCRPWRLAA